MSVNMIFKQFHFRAFQILDLQIRDTQPESEYPFIAYKAFHIHVSYK